MVKLANKSFYGEKIFFFFKQCISDGWSWQWIWHASDMVVFFLKLFKIRSFRRRVIFPSRDSHIAGYNGIYLKLKQNERNSRCNPKITLLNFVITWTDHLKKFSGSKLYLICKCLHITVHFYFVRNLTLLSAMVNFYL